MSRYSTGIGRVVSLLCTAGALFGTGLCPVAAAESASAPTQQMNSIYDISVTAQNGSRVPLSTYRGKVLLIVNTATHCGFTPQYNALQELYAEHAAAGLEVLDFPCNQFGEQAPGSDEDIHTFCTLRFKITFPQFAKVEVNGPHAAPLYRYLTEHAPFRGFGQGDLAGKMEQIAEKNDPNYRNNGAIKWNFTKFLIDREGKIVARFEPTESMETVKKAVEKQL